MDAATRASLDSTAHRFFDLASKGDAAGLRQSAIQSVAGNFSGIATALQQNQANLAAGRAVTRALFALTAEAAGSAQPSEFLCGVFGKTGQTASSAVFTLNGLEPGKYAVAILDVGGGTPPGGDTSKSEPYVVSFVLQQLGGAWKLGGFYAKPSRSGGHESAWFAERARAFATKGQVHNAWFYFSEARSLATIVPFMSTRETDSLYDEAQKQKPTDMPGETPLELGVGGKAYKIRTVFPYGVAGEENLVVKYDVADISDAAKAYAENQVVARALVTKWPELRDGFGAIVARATDPSGKDYGTLVGMAELK